MQMIENKTIKREALALQRVYGFDDDLFTEVASKLQFDVGIDKETAEKMAIIRIRGMYRK
jgi:hypothetical protein